MHRFTSLLKMLIVFAGVSVMVVGIALLVLPNPVVITNARTTLDSIATELMVLRLLVIAVLWTGWAGWIEWCYHDSTTAVRDYLKSRRHFIALVLLAIELLLIQNLPGALWQWVN